jgi:hypothetical protein
MRLCVPEYERYFCVRSSNCCVLFQLPRVVDRFSHLNSSKKVTCVLVLYFANGNSSRMFFSSTFFDYFFVKGSLAFYDYQQVFRQNEAFWTLGSGA